MAFDVLEEDPSRGDLADDAGDVGPEVAGVGLAAALSGGAEGLTGITGRDDMNSAAPRSAVEGSQIVPYSSRSQGLICHPRHERGRRVAFPFDVTHSPISGLGDMEPEVESAVAGAEGQSPKFGDVSWFGVKSHKARSLVWSLRRRSDGGSRASEGSALNSAGI